MDGTRRRGAAHSALSVVMAILLALTLGLPTAALSAVPAWADDEAAAQEPAATLATPAADSEADAQDAEATPAAGDETAAQESDAAPAANDEPAATPAADDKAVAAAEQPVDTLATDDKAFGDLVDGQWYIEHVEWAAAMGIMTGHDDGSGNFGVGEGLTRGQLAVLIAKWAGADLTVADNTTGLPDVASGTWYTAAVNWCFENGLITGYTDVETGEPFAFAPDDEVSREMAVTVFYRLSKRLGIDVSNDRSALAAMPDAGEVEDWAQEAMAWAVDREIITGSIQEDGSVLLEPDRSIKREEVAKVVHETDTATEGVIKDSAPQIEAGPVQPATATISGSVSLSGRDLAAGEFSFELRDASGAVVGTASNAADGSFSFTVSLSEAGTYSYTVAVASGPDDGTQWPSSAGSATVTVSEGEDGALSASVSGSPKVSATYTPPMPPVDPTPPPVDPDPEPEPEPEPDPEPVTGEVNGLSYVIYGEGDEGAYQGAGAYITGFTPSDDAAAPYAVTVPATVGEGEDAAPVVSVQVGASKIGQLDVSACADLKALECSSNALTALDLSKNAALTDLRCANNAQLTELALPAGAPLWRLECWYTSLNALDVSAYTTLTYLDCSSSGLSQLALPADGGALTHVFCQNNKIGQLDAIAALVDEGENIIAASYLPQTVALGQDIDGFLVDIRTGYDGYGMVGAYICGFSRTAMTSVAVPKTFTYNGAEYPVVSVILRAVVIEDLDVSACTELRYLNCSPTRVESLDLSKNAKLEYLNCAAGQLTSLNLSGCTALKELWCHQNQLTSLDLSACTSLEALGCSNNDITSLVIPETVLQSLTYLACEGNFLSDTAALEAWAAAADRGRADIYPQRASSDETDDGFVYEVVKQSAGDTGEIHIVDYTGSNPAVTIPATIKNLPVTSFEVWATSYTSLDATQCPTLENLDCSRGNLTSLKVAGCENLTDLDCSSNQLTELDLTGCTALESLSCTYNELTKLDVRACTNLTYLGCAFNNITDMAALDAWIADTQNHYGAIYPQTISGGVSAEGFVYEVVLNEDESFVSITGYEGDATELEVPYMLDGAPVTEVVLSYLNRNISSLDVSQCKSLTYLDCVGNGLSSLKVAGCSELVTLRCYGNELTALDITGCEALEQVYCSDNRIADLSALEAWLAEIGHYGNLYPQTASEGAVSGDFTYDLAVTATGKEASITGYTGASKDVTVPAIIDDVTVTEVRLNDYGFTSIDVSECKDLELLWCMHNELTSLDVSGLSKLWALACAGNALTSLDLEGCVSLNQLRCDYNELTELDTSDCPDFTWLQVSYNHLTDPSVFRVSGTFQFYPQNVEEGLEWNGFVYSTATTEAGASVLITDYTGGEAELVVPADINGATVTEAYLGGLGLTSLDVSACAELAVLSCGSNNLTELTLGSHPKLESIQCGGNELTALDISGCPALTQLYCSNNRISDLSELEAWAAKDGHYGSLYPQYAEGGETTEGLEYEIVYEESDSCVRVTDYTGASTSVVVPAEIENLPVKEIELNRLGLTSLDVSACEELLVLECMGNELTTLDLSGNPALTSLRCQGNAIVSLDLSNNPELTMVECHENRVMESIDLSNCAKLDYLFCSYNNLAELDISDCAALTQLRCGDNRIADLTALEEWASGDISFAELYPQYVQNDLSADGFTYDVVLTGLGQSAAITGYTGSETELVVPGAINEMPVVYASLRSLGLTSLGLSDCENLIELDCSFNELTELDLSGCSSLESLGFYSNKLTSLDVEPCPNLTTIWGSENRIENVASLEEWAAADEMHYLDIYPQVLEEDIQSGDFVYDVIVMASGKGTCIRSCTDGLLNVTVPGKIGEYAVKMVELNWRDLESMDVTACADLEVLYCNGNQLTELDLSGCPKLVEIDCSTNKLKSLDISKNTQLEELWCEYNWISDLSALRAWRDTASGSCSMYPQIQKEGELDGFAYRVYADEIRGMKTYAEIYSYTGESTEVVVPAAIDGHDVVAVNVQGRGDLTKLDVSQCAKLERLECGYNQLTELDVSHCPRLWSLWCSYNQIADTSALEAWLDVPGHEGEILPQRA